MPKHTFLKTMMLLLVTWGLVSCGQTPTVTVVPTATSAAETISVSPLSMLGKGLAHGVAWSPDRTLLAVSSSLGIELYDAQTLEQVRQLESDVAEGALVFSPDGTLLASVSDLGVRLWDVETGDVERRLVGRGKLVTAIAFAPMASGSEWLLAVGTEDGTIYLWWVQTGVLAGTLLGHTAAVTDLGFSADGALLASGSEDGTIRLWRVSSGAEIKTLKGHSSPVVALSFWNFGFEATEELFSVSLDGLFQTWDVSGCEANARSCGNVLSSISSWGAVTAAALAPDLPLFAAGTLDGQLVLVSPVEDCPDPEAEETWCWMPLQTRYPGPIAALALSADTARLAVVLESGGVAVWDVAGCAEGWSRCQDAAGQYLPGYTTGLDALLFAQGGALIAAGGQDGRVWLWDVDGSSEQPTLQGVSQAYVGSIFDLALAPDQDVLALVGDDRTVGLWRISDGTSLASWEGHTWLVTSAAFSPDGTLVATGSCDKTVRLWRRESGELLETLAHDDCVRSLAFSPDGALLATGSGSGELLLWQVSEAQVMRSLEGHKAAVYDVTFSSDGEMLASASGDGTVRLWSVEQGEALRVFQGHQDAVTGVAFSPDDIFLASCSKDRTARLWQVGNGLLLYTLNHRDWVMDLAFSDDGMLLASAVRSGIVRLWSVQGSTVTPRQ